MICISKAPDNAGKQVFFLNNDICVGQNADYSLNAQKPHHFELQCASKIESGKKSETICPVSEALTSTLRFGDVTCGKLVTKPIARGRALRLAVLCKGHMSHLDPKALCRDINMGMVEIYNVYPRVTRTWIPSLQMFLV